MEAHEYGHESAVVMGSIIKRFLDKRSNQGSGFYQQYILQKGLSKYGEQGRAGVEKEIRQLHDRGCFNPISREDISNSELKKTVGALIFLTEKKDASIKGRIV